MNYELLIFSWLIGIWGMLLFGISFRYLMNYQEYWENRLYSQHRYDFSPFLSRELFVSDADYNEFQNNFYKRMREREREMRERVEVWKAQRYIHIPMRIACIVGMFFVLVLAIRTILYCI